MCAVVAGLLFPPPQPDWDGCVDFRDTVVYLTYQSNLQVIPVDYLSGRMLKRFLREHGLHSKADEIMLFFDPENGYLTALLSGGGCVLETLYFEPVKKGNGLRV